MATTIGMDAAGSRAAPIIPNSQVVSAKPKDPSGAGLASFKGSFDHWQSGPDIHCQGVVGTILCSVCSWQPGAAMPRLQRFSMTIITPTGFLRPAGAVIDFSPAVWRVRERLNR